MNVRGLFREFEFTHFTAIHREREIVLWVGNGFLGFSDYNSACESGRPFLRGMRLVTRWRLWREYKCELRRRSRRKIEMLANG